MDAFVYPISLVVPPGSSSTVGVPRAVRSRPHSANAPIAAEGWVVRPRCFCAWDCCGDSPPGGVTRVVQGEGSRAGGLALSPERPPCGAPRVRSFPYWPTGPTGSNSRGWRGRWRPCRESDYARRASGSNESKGQDGPDCCAWSGAGGRIVWPRWLRAVSVMLVLSAPDPGGAALVQAHRLRRR
jgi:hypothetical protein